MTDVMNTATPKEQIHTLMCEMFEMIEGLNINEGQYLQFADMFRNMNLNVNRLTEIKQIIIQNTYYQNHIRRKTIRRKRLTEEQKSKSQNYTL